MAIIPIEEQENATKPPKLDIPEPENSGVLTSQDANDFVSEKTNELRSQVNDIQGLLKTGGKDPQISEIQQFLNTSGKYENLGDGRYHVGLPGSQGWTFNVQDLEADPGAKGYIESVKAGGDPMQGLGMSISRGVNVRSVQDRYKTQREALAESQKQKKASTQASEFRSGRTGAGLAEESITAKTDQALERQRKDFQDAVQRSINAALDELQAGNIRAFQEKQKMIADEKQSYLDELEQTQDIALKMQTYEEKAIKIGEDRRTSASKVIGDYAKAGTEITDKQFEIIAGTYGIDVEDARNIYNIAQVESSIALDKADQEYAKSELDIETKEFDLRKKQMDDYLAMADKIGVAVPVQIGNSEYTYYGYNSTRVQNGTEYNKETGEFFHWSVDRTDPTRPRVTTTPISNIGVNWELKDLGTNGWWRVSPDGKQWLPATPGVTQVTNDQVFPEGSTPPPRPGGSPANAGQCGSYWGLKTGVTDMPADFDSFTGKKNYLEARGAIDKQEIQAGTTFLQKAGTTGHIGFVGDVIYDPNTHEAIGFYADESNYVPPNGRKVSYSRPVYFNDPTLAGFYNVPVQNQIASGPDVSVQTTVSPSIVSSSTGAIMTGKPTDIESNKPLSASEIKTYQELGYDVTPGMTASDLNGLVKTGDEKKPLSEEYKVEKSNAVITAANNVLSLIKGGTTGLDGILKAKIPGTQSFNLAKRIDTLKANIGFNELNAMRAASPTGGALGQVSERELTYLQATLGSLDQAQSEEELRKNVNGIIESVKRWQENQKKYEAESPDVASGNTPKTLPTLPANFSTLTANGRKNGWDDTSLLTNFLKHYPEYKDMVQKARDKGVSTTDILDYLGKK